MASSPQDILDKVDAAIEAIVEGRVESASEGIRAFTNLGLDKLWAMRADLKAEVSASGRRQILSPIRRVNL